MMWIEAWPQGDFMLNLGIDYFLLGFAFRGVY